MMFTCTSAACAAPAACTAAAPFPAATGAWTTWVERVSKPARDEEARTMGGNAARLLKIRRR